jgi:hypothetical protein
MVINLSNNGKVGNTTLSSYDKVMIIDHKPESKLLVLKLHSGDRIDFSYEELEETPIIVGVEYQIFISGYKGKNEKGEALSGIQFTELYPVH